MIRNSPAPSPHIHHHSHVKDPPPKPAHWDLTSSILSFSLLSTSNRTSAFHVTVYPPSTLRSAPVTYVDASESRKVTGPMRSSGDPMRPWGMREVHCRLRSGLSSRIFWVLHWGFRTRGSQPQLSPVPSQARAQFQSGPLSSSSRACVCLWPSFLGR